MFAAYCNPADYRPSLTCLCFAADRSAVISIHQQLTTGLTLNKDNMFKWGWKGDWRLKSYYDRFLQNLRNRNIFIFTEPRHSVFQRHATSIEVKVISCSKTFPLLWQQASWAEILSSTASCPLLCSQASIQTPTPLHSLSPSLSLSLLLFPPQKLSLYSP